MEVHELQGARMMTRTASVAALMLAIGTAHAEYFTYSDWSKQPADFRAAYIAGLYDALVSIAETNAEAKIGAHYQACVRRAKMRNGQLAESTRLYGSARPERTHPAEAALRSKAQY